MSKTADDVYDDLMQVALKHWEEFTPNAEIAEGVLRFQRQMEQWVDKHKKTEDGVCNACGMTGGPGRPMGDKYSGCDVCGFCY